MEEKYFDKTRKLSNHKEWSLCILFMLNDNGTIEVNEDYNIPPNFYLKNLEELENIINEFGLPQIGSMVSLTEEYRKVYSIDYDYERKILYFHLL